MGARILGPSGAALLLTTALAAGLHGQEPLGTPTAPRAAASCMAAALDDPSLEWRADATLAGDFTLDGAPDAATWGATAGELVLLVGRCLAGDVVEQWRFPVSVPEACDVRSVRVEAGSLLIDQVLLDRACARGAAVPECIHLRRENARRQTLVDAGGRELRVGGPSCPSFRLRWDEERRGFMMLRR